MNITTHQLEAVTVVRLAGDLDTSSSTPAQDAINEVIDGGAIDLLINLEDVGFVSSAGLRVLLATAKRLGAEDGHLRISNLNETVNEVFEISGFSSILNVFPTQEDALRGS